MCIEMNIETEMLGRGAKWRCQEEMLGRNIDRWVEVAGVSSKRIMKLTSTKRR